MVVEHRIKSERPQPELDEKDLATAEMFNQGIKAGLLMAARQIQQMADNIPSLEEAVKREN